MYGLEVPKDVLNAHGEPVRYWGCRAIDQGGVLDVVHDRITYRGPKSDEQLPQDEWQCLPFVWWLNNTAMPKLRATLSSLPHEKVVVVDQKGQAFGLVVRRAGGYAYVGAWEHHVGDNRYDLTEKPKGEWSNPDFDPNIGDHVLVNFNGLGTGTVASYFVEHGYRGVRVKLDQQPEWHQKQGQPPYALVFGAEIKAAQAPEPNEV